MNERIADERPHDVHWGMEWLALCPLLAVSDTVINALGMSVVILIVVPLSISATLLTRRWLTTDTMLAGGMLLIAGIVACVELLMTAWFHDLRQSLGVFVPLIVTNVVLVAHLQATRSSPGRAFPDGMKLALGIAVTLVLLSFARELVGRGSLLHGVAMLDARAAALETKVFRVDMGFLLAMLPPGAFISLGLLLAARNWLRRKNS